MFIHMAYTPAEGLEVPPLRGAHPDARLGRGQQCRQPLAQGGGGGRAHGGGGGGLAGGYSARVAAIGGDASLCTESLEDIATLHPIVCDANLKRGEGVGAGKGLACMVGILIKTLVGLNLDSWRTITMQPCHLAPRNKISEVKSVPYP